MKKIFFLAMFFTILIGTSCRAQKMINSVNDAIKLQENSKKFIGKPLSVLLAQIKPKIKFVIGNPDNKSMNAVEGTFLRFHFLDKDEFLRRHFKNDTPTIITVNFQTDPNNTRKHLPKEGISQWTDTETKEYGDMVVMRISIIGKD